VLQDFARFVGRTNGFGKGPPTERGDAADGFEEAQRPGTNAVND
jgi:hypothetical protein